MYSLVELSMNDCVCMCGCVLFFKVFFFYKSHWAQVSFSGTFKVFGIEVRIVRKKELCDCCLVAFKAMV